MPRDTEAIDLLPTLTRATRGIRRDYRAMVDGAILEASATSRAPKVPRILEINNDTDNQQLPEEGDKDANFILFVDDEEILPTESISQVRTTPTFTVMGGRNNERGENESTISSMMFNRPRRQEAWLWEYFYITVL